MSGDGAPKNEYLLQEYASTHDAYLHYDNFSWQVGSVLIAGVFVFWGFLLQGQPSANTFVACAILVTGIMSAWALYANHNRQIYLQKLDRLREIEKLLGLDQHQRWKKGVYRTFGPKGHQLNQFIYFVMCIGAPLIGWSTLQQATWWLSLPVVPVPIVIFWIRRNEKALNRHN